MASVADLNTHGADPCIAVDSTSIAHIPKLVYMLRTCAYVCALVSRLAHVLLTTFILIA